MPKGKWTDKDERMYEHIYHTGTGGGRSTKTAKRIAAATVNKARAKRKKK